ncbi:MAG: hypothetical protein ACKOBV_08330 [Candidatus Kapaibacterium sp.]
MNIRRIIHIAGVLGCFISASAQENVTMRKSVLQDTAAFVRYVHSVTGVPTDTATLYELYTDGTCIKCSVLLSGVLAEMRTTETIRNVCLVMCNRRKEFQVLKKTLSGYDACYGVFGGFRGFIEQGVSPWTQAFLLRPDGTVRLYDYDEIEKLYRQMAAERKQQSK